MLKKKMFCPENNKVGRQSHLCRVKTYNKKSKQVCQEVISKNASSALKMPNSIKKGTRSIHNDTFKTPNSAFKGQYINIMYIKRIKLTPLV